MERPTPQQDSFLINAADVPSGMTALDLVLGRKPTVGTGGFDNKMTG